MIENEKQYDKALQRLTDILNDPSKMIEVDVLNAELEAYENRVEPIEIDPIMEARVLKEWKYKAN